MNSKSPCCCLLMQTSSGAQACNSSTNWYLLLHSKLAFSRSEESYKRMHLTSVLRVLLYLQTKAPGRKPSSERKVPQSGLPQPWELLQMCHSCWDSLVCERVCLPVLILTRRKGVESMDGGRCFFGIVESHLLKCSAEIAYVFL